jgi:Dna[CI] antecedent, DciA
MTSNSSDLEERPKRSASNVPSNSQPQIFGKWLKAQKDLQKLAPVMAELALFQKELDLAHPLLMLRAVALKDDQLIVATPSPSVAAKLRQSTPSLLAAINAACDTNQSTNVRKVNRIRFKPQMGFSATKGLALGKIGKMSGSNSRSRTLTNVVLPTNAIAMAEAMIEHCEHEKLKFALTRLISRHKNAVR